MGCAFRRRLGVGGEGGGEAVITEVDGGFVISSRGVWLPGVYKTKEAAQYAFQFSDVMLQYIQDSSTDGTISIDMLKAARRKHQQ